MAKQDLEQEIKDIVDAGVERTTAAIEHKALPLTRDKTVVPISPDAAPDQKLNHYEATHTRIIEESQAEIERRRDQIEKLTDEISDLDVTVNASQAFLEIIQAKRDACPDSD